MAYVIAIPLALLLGILAASPDELAFVLLATLLFCLALPLFVGWHHALLIVFWNSAFVAAFFPGQPTVLFLVAAFSFCVAMLNSMMGRKTFLPVPEMTRPILLLVAVVLGTACYRGGIGIKALGGSAFGGKDYALILDAVLGYFALTAGQIASSKSRKMVGMFFLSGTTSVLSNIVYTLGPAFYFFYYFVPSGFAVGQAASDYGLASSDRIQGLAPACINTFCFLLAIYGIRGLFNLAKPWRLFFLLITAGASFFTGFRSIVVLLSLIFAFQFYFEGLLRTRLLPVMVGISVCVCVSVLFFANRLPMAVQRAISFLPVNVDSAARADALGSSEWRFQMWAVVWKEVPKYLLIGKGYGIDPTELYLLSEASRSGGGISDYEIAMLAGDYHNGPLSVLVPFGVAGSVAFLWVLVAGGRVLSLNFHNGDARLRLINCTLLSFYLAECVTFFLVFGALSAQMYIFLGIVGFSVSLNGGVRRRSKAEPEISCILASPAFAVEVR